MMRDILIISFLLSFYSCHSVGKESKIIKNAQVFKLDIDTIKYKIDKDEIINMSLDTAIAKYGKPKTIEGFTLGVMMHQFRSEVANFYTKKQEESRSILMKEVTWAPDTINLVTVWYELKDSATVPIHVRKWDVNTYY